MEKASKLIKDDPQKIAHVYLIKGRISAAQKDWQQAIQFYEQAATALEKDMNWFLKANIAEEQGLAYLENNLLNKSAQAFNFALSFYQIIQSPIGINSTQLHLANVLFPQGNIEDAMKLYLQAKKNIQGIKLEFLYSMLDDYEKKFNKYFANKAD